MEEEIKAEFAQNGFTLDEEEEVLKKCNSFCINFKLTPSDLVSSWEVYYLNRQINGSRVQNIHMDGFLLHLQNEQMESIRKEEPHLHIYSVNDVDMMLSNEPEDGNEGMYATPVKQSERLYDESYNLISPTSRTETPETSENPFGKSSSRLASTRMTPFGQRTNRFALQFAFNSHIADNGIKDHDTKNPEDDVIRRVQPIEWCSMQVQGTRPEFGCRFMYDRNEDKFNILENRIRRLTDALVASKVYSEPTDATLASQKSLFAVGMVYCEGEGRLNDKSVLLQGSVDHSGGQRVRLDLQKLVQFSLFPGQVIGIEGHNPSGHCFIVSKLADSFPLLGSSDVGLPPAKKQARDQEYEPTTMAKTSRELSLVIASGPFSTTDNLLFEPLIELLAYASRKQPQLLILLGPFLDSEHPQIKKGTIDKSFDEVFREEILRRLQDYVEYMGSSARVILVPSTRDANHDFVFPQPAFDIHPSNDPKHQITCLTNPGIFNASEVKVGCCTVDILKQLSSEEISISPSSDDRVRRLATHILKQCSFYPLYPPAVGVPLDLSLAPEALQISSVPDILILPSDLNSFVKVLELGEIDDKENCARCICVNPGRLSKGVSGGTFVELNYHGNPDRTNASIIRI